MQTPLTAVAEAINAARIAANQNDITAPQTGVYGALVEALWDVLNMITADLRKADRVYQAILDGATVTEALNATK